MPITKIRRLLAEGPEPQYVVAAKVGIDPATLTKISLGKKYPKPHQAQALAQYFGVELADVIGLEDDESAVG